MINATLDSQSYQHAKLGLWTSNIVENCLKELSTMDHEPGKVPEHWFKYVGALGTATRAHRPVPSSRDVASVAPAVTCALQQKTGAGLQTAHCAYWDKSTDGSARPFHPRLAGWPVTAALRGRLRLHQMVERHNTSDRQRVWRAGVRSHVCTAADFRAGRASSPSRACRWPRSPLRSSQQPGRLACLSRSGR